MPLSSLLTPFPALLRYSGAQGNQRQRPQRLGRSVAFSPDGKTIVSGSDDKTIKVWDAGEPFHLLPCCLGLASDALLRPSQVLWSSRRAKRAPTGAVHHSVAFSPDGKTIVSWLLRQDDQSVGRRCWFSQLPSACPSLTRFSLPFQVLWSSRRARRTPTAAPLLSVASLRRQDRSSLAPRMRRSKCGTQVSRFTFCLASCPRL